jgi:ribonuclease R
LNASRKKPAHLPSKEEILEFIRESPAEIGKREIARAFRITGSDRIPLKALLKEMAAEGLIDRGRGRRLREPGSLPNVAVVEVTGIDEDGEVLARPVSWEDQAPPPVIYLAPERRGAAALGVGERMLARLVKLEDGTYQARIIRRIHAAPNRVLGVYSLAGDGGRLTPTARRYRDELAVAKSDSQGAREGELVLAELLPGKPLGQKRARVVERLGDAEGPNSVSLIAVHSHDIPTEFSAKALALAEAAKPVPLGKRSDLRGLPLITIDGADARDFDDAVWAESDPEPGNKGGWHLVVAIADVANYVRPGDALDVAAYERGNSVYFPDRVVPMLPEALSNDLCSLRPGVERACLAAHLWIDRDGALLRHRFERGLMRSAARLTYSQVQEARDGQSDEATGPLLSSVIEPLYGAYAALAAARDGRQALDIELPERRVVVAEDGTVERIEPRARLDSHKLIEEFMITANVAAAETLERIRRPCMYRIHEQPDPVKVEALREFLAGIGYRLARGQVIRPRHFNDILHKSAGTPHQPMVHQLVLRSQNQAVYGPNNLGHFGLSLVRYAHFTSPIRRYADLLVHRALIGGLGLGEGGIGAEAGGNFVTAGEHLSGTERRAAAAERDAVDRFTAAFLADRVGDTFAGSVNGVTRFGLFVTLDETGADGIVPMRSLPDDYYFHDEDHHRLVGERHGRIYTLGERVEVRLVEAAPITGSLVFELLDAQGAARQEARGAATGRRRKPTGRPPRRPGKPRGRHKRKR